MEKINYSKKPAFLFLIALSTIFLFLGVSAHATHLRGGYIQVKSDTTANPNPNRFFFKLVTYSVSGGFEDNKATLYFGDCTSQTVTRTGEFLVSNVTINTYYFEHTYPGAGTFTASFLTNSRNGNVVNATSTGEPKFLIQSTFVIDPFLGTNKSPIIHFHPVDHVSRNKVYTYNPAAFDPEGDSLSFKTMVPLTGAISSSCANPTAVNLTGYSGLGNYLGTTDPSSPVGFSLHPNTGQVTWNTPSSLGMFTLAYVIEEWRNNRLIGKTIVDFDLVVQDFPNQPPKLQVPADICVAAGTQTRQTITASDPDQQALLLNYFSNLPAGATITQTGNTYVLEWTPTCQDVRAQPYQVVFRAVDQPAPATDRLSALQPLRITVLAPPPSITASVWENTSSIRLNWQNATCGTPEKLYIYRKDGTSSLPSCQVGLTASTGFSLAGEVNAGTTTFLDNSSSLDRSKNYCYRIVAVYAGSTSSRSVISNESCASVVMGMKDDLQQEIRLFPNPAATQVAVQTPPSVHVSGATVMNTLGQTVGSLVPQKTDIGWSLDVSMLPKGLYLMHLTTSKGSFVRKLLIEQ
ncbi:MAG: T9SS type A sorting domain-containing protein [Rufibacter sp.]